MSGHRQAAVALYGASELDRQLVLAQLEPSDQVLLRGYLAELSELGFSAAHMAAYHPVTPHQSNPPPPAAKHGVLHAANAQQLYAVLREEPASLVAQLLALDAWPWAPTLLAMYEPARRLAITQAAGGTVMAPAKAAALRALLAERLPPLSAAPAAAPLNVRTALRKARKWLR